MKNIVKISSYFLVIFRDSMLDAFHKVYNVTESKFPAIFLSGMNGHSCCQLLLFGGVLEDTREF